MRTLRTIFGALYEKILIAIGVLIVLLPISPLNIVQPARDSGVFLYAGWRMLHGDIPYLDIWDHKPPVIFFVNALGLLLGGGSIWGVWLVELLLLFFAALLGFTLIKRYLGSLPAIFALSLWLLSLAFIINGGNLTTEYTLIIQFAMLWLAVVAEEKDYFFWRGYLIGVLAADSLFDQAECHWHSPGDRALPDHQPLNGAPIPHAGAVASDHSPRQPLCSWSWSCSFSSSAAPLKPFGMPLLPIISSTLRPVWRSTLKAASTAYACSATPAWPSSP